MAWLGWLGWDICITDSTYYKSTASGANKHIIAQFKQILKAKIQSKNLEQIKFLQLNQMSEKELPSVCGYPVL